MRILQVHNRYRQRGGEDGVVAAEADLLREHGHEVIEHTASNPSGAGAAASLAVAPWNPVSARAIRRAVNENRPDVAHVHNTWFTLSPSVLGALHRAEVPVVMTVHNYRLVCVNALVFRDGKPCTDCVGHSPWAGVKHRCYRDSRGAVDRRGRDDLDQSRARDTWVNAVDVFISPSILLRDTLVSGGLPADRFVVRPHAVADVGARTRPPSSSSTVLYVGRVSAEKGVNVLLDAWAHARPAALELVVVGEGPQREELERRGVEGVRFTGWLAPDAVRELMLESRALVFPSLCFESFGLTIVEAMAAGLPVIASAHGSSAEIVGEIGAEWLAEPARTEPWAERLGLLTDDTAVDAAGVRAREIYSSRYAPERGIGSLLDAYQSAIDSGSRR